MPISRFRFAVAVLLALSSFFLLGAENLSRAYQKWLEEDVCWIIKDQERAEFVKLSTDQQRDEFIVAFWERRNPAPGVKENKFKEEHYRRLAYANEHFAFNTPGWKTDRGRIYILYGPPDDIEEHPFAADSEFHHRYQVWHYRRLLGTGEDATATFVDVCGCGDYRRERGEASKNSLPQ